MENLTFNPNELVGFINKKTETLSKYNQERKERWDKARENCRHFIDTTKDFFSQYGIKIDFVLDTEFDLKEASNGFYPYLRQQNLLLCFHPHDKGYVTKGYITYTYTEFIKIHILSNLKW